MPQMKVEKKVFLKCVDRRLPIIESKVYESLAVVGGLEFKTNINIIVGDEK